MADNKSAESSPAANSSSSATSVTLSQQQLQDIIKAAVAGAMAQMSLHGNNTVTKPTRPTVDLNCNENR